MNNTHLTYTADDEVIEALFKCNGNVKKTALRLGLTNPHELRKRINGKAILKEAMQDALEQLLDDAEIKVTTNMTKADAKWILERKGRNRGWGTVIANANLNVDVKDYDLSSIPLAERQKLLEIMNGDVANDSTDTE